MQLRLKIGAGLKETRNHSTSKKDNVIQTYTCRERTKLQQREENASKSALRTRYEVLIDPDSGIIANL